MQGGIAGGLFCYRLSRMRTTLAVGLALTLFGGAAAGRQPA